MSAPSPPRARRQRAASRLAGDARGATAVEFGLVALPFLALLGALIQVAFTIWAQQNFDFVFQKAARTIFTGQFQAKNDQGATDATLLTAFQNKMCSDPASVIFNCSAVKLDISLSSTFAGSGPPAPINPATRDWNTTFGSNYTCAAPGALVVATAAVKFPVFFGLLNAGLSNFSDGSKLLEATVVFKTEPYALAANSPCPAS